jgi:hypothetical protein
MKKPGRSAGLLGYSSCSDASQRMRRPLSPKRASELDRDAAMLRMIAICHRPTTPSMLVGRNRFIAPVREAHRRLS